MNLLSIVMYACLLLPLHLKTMDQCEFKRQIHSPSYTLFTSRVSSSYNYQPAPRKAIGSLKIVSPVPKNHTAQKIH